MKKIYSFMLMATMLLIGINVKAANQSVSTEDELQTAFNQAVDGDVITVSTDFSISTTVKIAMPVGDKVTLNLAGNTLSASGSVVEMFKLYRGELVITGVEGSAIVHTTNAVTSPAVIKVFGAMAKIANHTCLTIDENVTLKVTGSTYVDNKGKTQTPKGYGITINELYKARTGTDPNYVYYDIVDNVRNEDFYRTSFANNSATGFANGVVVNVKGRIEMLCSKGYCVKVNGNIQFAGSKVGSTISDGSGNSYTIAQADSAEWVAVAPYVKLHSTSYLTATANATGVGAIYCAGYGKWDIQGYADGSSALAIKSGEVNVTNATLKSTASSYEGPKDASSGLDAQGSAVLVLTTSNATYAGDIQLNISGDTKVEAQAGYALEEIVTIPTTSSEVHTNVETINIQGGSFVGGAEKGVIAVDVVTKTEKVDAFTIGGGSYTAQTEEQQTATQTLLEALLGNQTPSDPAYTIEVNNGGASQTGTSIVISKTEIPTAVEEEYTFAKLQTAELNNEDVNLEKAQVEGGELVIADDITLQNLYMNCDNPLSIIIPNGITMTAKRIVMGNNDNITIQAGGKLVIYGDQGLYNVKNENLLIEAEEGNMGIFLFKPTVATNRHPHGIVQLVSKAYTDGSVQIWQRFGVPAYRGIARSAIGRTLPTAFRYWDNDAKQWDNVPTNDKLIPFQGYALGIQTNDPGAEYTFACDSLYGSVNAPLVYVPDWNYLSNSYTAKIDIKNFIDKLVHSGVEAAIHVNLLEDANSNNWTSVSYGDLEDGLAAVTKLDPMQCFTTRLHGEEIFKDTINYETMVWNPAMDIVPNNDAPARRNMQASDYTRAIVVIANGNNEQQVTLRQSAQFSDEFENGYDVSKYKAGEVSLYANTENGEQSQVATDNLMGQTLSVESDKAATFKMTFKNLRGETLAIRDNMTGSVINMTEGEEYFFSVAPGTTADRFEIIEAAKMPTDVEMLEAAPAKKGIYTLVGQYLGENFDVLPAGIYVVNGKKVVK